ncbi:MAG: thiamine-phosphate kinase [Rhodobiaceae bacterium]|nr:thiamine-phosphate kinase [Rhodobiaceae bacterium]
MVKKPTSPSVSKSLGGEFGLIRELLAPLAQNASALGLRDDAAVFTPPSGYDLVISTDALVAGVHFPSPAEASLVANRALACNISDLAAKGATPAGCTLSLGLSPDWEAAYLRDLMTAFGRGLNAWGLELWGGDTVRTPTSFLSLTVYGLVPHGKMVQRAGAQMGDDVYVTGVLGDGWLGLQQELGEQKHLEDVRKAYSDPQPPLALGQKLVDIATSSLDISDGLMADLDHLCLASGVCMDIQLSDIPYSGAGQAYLHAGGALERLLGGGDDLQIGFTAPPEKAAALTALAQATQTQLTKIGRVTCKAGAGDGPTTRAVLRSQSGAEIALETRGYRHF